MFQSQVIVFLDEVLNFLCIENILDVLFSCVMNLMARKRRNI